MEHDQYLPYAASRNIVRDRCGSMVWECLTENEARALALRLNSAYLDGQKAAYDKVAAKLSGATGGAA